MASRDQILRALNALHRRPIDFDNTPRELWVPEQEFGDVAEDRAVALVGTAFLERCIRDALLTHMVPLNSEERQQLFGPEAPLGQFSARIRLGYALGMFNRNDFRDLDCIRRIRNIFAHFHEHADFGSPEIVDACSLLQNKWYLESYQRYETRRAKSRATFATRVLLYAHFFAPTGQPNEKVMLPNAAESSP